MLRQLTLVALSVVGGLGLVSAADAQVFVRAPFVRVQVGGGVWVRAPFVNLWVPPAPPYYVGPPVYITPPIYAPSVPRVVESPLPPAFEAPQPKVVPQPPAPQQPAVPQPLATNRDNEPPQPSKAVKVPTLEQFVNSFQPKPGNYEVTILNPVTNQPTTVRFSLPEGSPRRVQVRRAEIEFDYGIRRFVRIEFDKEGVMVISR